MKTQPLKFIFLKHFFYWLKTADQKLTIHFLFNRAGAGKVSQLISSLFNFVYLSITGSFYWFVDVALFQQNNIYADNYKTKRTTNIVFKDL